MKFGGTSVANFEAITRTIFIIGGRLDQKPVVVVSALSKVTDLLYRISDAAASKDLPQTRELLGQLRKRHVDLTEELLAQSMLKEEAVARVNELCDSLEGIAMAVCSLGIRLKKNHYAGFCLPLISFDSSGNPERLSIGMEHSCKEKAENQTDFQQIAFK